MNAPGFRVLNKEELAKLTTEERIAYMALLVQHVQREIDDTRKSIAARNERAKKPE